MVEEKRATPSPAPHVKGSLEALYGEKCDQYIAACKEIDRLREALGDLVSWFPEKAPEPEWRLKAGQYGADDAIEAARAALAQASEGGRDE